MFITENRRIRTLSSNIYNNRYFDILIDTHFHNILTKINNNSFRLYYIDIDKYFSRKVINNI